MTVKEMIDRLKECNPNSEVELEQEETLECATDLWDEEKDQLRESAATLIDDWDLYSHGFYLFVKR